MWVVGNGKKRHCRDRLLFKQSMILRCCYAGFSSNRLR